VSGSPVQLPRREMVPWRRRLTCPSIIAEVKGKGAKKYKRPTMHGLVSDK
jgi:hypothetical protein